MTASSDVGAPRQTTGTPTDDARRAAAVVLGRHIAGLTRVLVAARLDLADLDPPDADGEAQGDPVHALLETLFAARPDAARGIRDAVLGKVLRDTDRVRRGVLLETLAAWVASAGSAADAAEVLSCNRNTVLNRLHTLERRTGRTLVAATNSGDPRFGDLFEVMLALRAHEFLGSADGRGDHRGKG